MHYLIPLSVFAITFIALLGVYACRVLLGNGAGGASHGSFRDWTVLAVCAVVLALLAGNFFLLPGLVGALAGIVAAACFYRIFLRRRR